jgi:hypothetical protein
VKRFPAARHVLVALAAAAAGAALALACDDEHKRTPRGKLLGGGGACEAPAGSLPKPDCDNSSRACAPVPGCTIDEAICGSVATCLPLADNGGKDVVDLRFRRLNIAAPASLASSVIQNTIVNSNLDLEARSCGERGTGLFTWLMRVDRKAGTLLTGGAPPSSDPFGQGFCFARFELNGTTVQPFASRIELAGGTFRTMERADVNIPIFTSEQLSSAIVLPIRGARIEGVTLSPDGNCIGAFNAAALDPACAEDRDLCPKWTTAGALGGYITLEEADGIRIEAINKSLCAYLAAENEPVCAREGGKIAFKGDFCAADYAAGGCQDSVWLAATFAASAARIFDGAGAVEGCSGASATVDAGADGASDAAADADAP